MESNFFEDNSSMRFYAHSKEGADKAEWQRLIDHLKNTAALAYEFGRDAGVSELAATAGLIHDIGKYSFEFQRRLEGDKHRVDHSTPGAKELVTFYGAHPQKHVAELLAYCIAGHHTGLPDGGSGIDVDGDGTLQARLKVKNVDYSAYKAEIDFSILKLPERLSIRPLKNHFGFSAAFLTRMVYSALVDADFQETQAFMSGKKPRGDYESIETLCQKFNQYLQKFDNPENPINQKRTTTLKNCVDKSNEKPGFFTLTVPTGGGKTLASMAFALNHAVKHGLKRVIYVIPFTSIIEQNAAVFKECLEAENVLEHHSNFDWEQIRSLESESPDNQTNSAYVKLKLAAENWDIPIVVTTNVQFFESLFANRSSSCRKLHNIAKSVIISDEAQMLPRDYFYPCMDAIWELVTNYGASSVFCTATQPSLHKFFPEGTRFLELASDPQELFDFYKRVQIKPIGKISDALLLEKINTQKQVLCIVNTRKHAKGLFDSLLEGERFHLSTLMCPAHRKQILREIRERLKNNQACHVVSTQVMEAGIDVDFPVGYRSLAGLDSIIQAAGRVNREGKAKSGEMFVFEPDSEFVKRIPKYIEQGAAVARNVLREHALDPVSIDAIQAFYEQLYSLQDGKRAFDTKEILACFDKVEGFDFKTAAEKFRIIENDMVSIIIPFDKEAKKLIEELKYTLFPVSTIRKLQPYTVNVYKEEFQAINSKGVIEVVADKYAVLSDMTYYHPETGIIIPECSRGDAIFF
jgi:CRISPR-associated endonuclease/helicase Cas3